MSDEPLMDEALEDLHAKALAARALPPQTASGRSAEQRATLLAFQEAASPDVVLALVEEVRRVREAEARKATNYDWLEKARREGTAVLLGRTGWALPKLSVGSTWTPKHPANPSPGQAPETWTVESGPNATGSYTLRCGERTRELTADELRRDFVPLAVRR
jgi:hypothetical protein